MKNFSDADLLEQLAIYESREDFWAYRQFINGSKLKEGWWQKEVARVLHNFYEEFVAGKRPIYIIQAPPQHGKSVQIVEFLSWLVGHNPDLKMIYASFSERLGIRANLRLQRIFDSPIYQKIFPETKINSKSAVTISAQYLRNREIMEFVDHQGFFRNTTVRGPITGEGLDIGIIDDPIKGRAEANSETVRNSTWDWFTDDFFSRFSDQAGTLMILTRWHVDDPAGRLEKTESNVKVFKYQAVATQEEEFRSEGEALFPEHKPIDFLLKRKALMASASWESLYQQNPYIEGGNLFREEYWRYYRQADLPRYFDEIIQSWDMAFKDKIENDWVVGLVMARKGANYYVLDCVRKHLDYKGSKIAVVQMTSRWPLAKRKFVEDKANGPAIISDLKDHIPGLIEYNPEDQSKIARSLAVVHNVEAQNVYLPHPDEAFWVKEFIAELAKFPNGAHDDQVDAFTQGLNRLELAGSAIRNYEALTRR